MADATGDAAWAAEDAGPGSAGTRARDSRGASVEVCPLLAIARSAGASAASVEGQASPVGGALGVGGPGPAHADPGNGCAASDPPLAVSVTQQSLVCLDAAHVDCPRFVRALGSARTGGGRIGRTAVPPVEVAVVAARPPAVDSTQAVQVAPVAPVAPVIRSRRRSGARPSGSRPTPLIVAAGVLVAAAVLAVAFTALRGGLSLPGASPSAAAIVSSAPSASTSAQPSPTPVPTSTPTVTPSPTPAPTPTPSPTRSAAPTPTPSPALPAAFQGLKPCPDAADCYLYKVRPGDNLTSIAAHFGVTLKALKAANPEIKDPSLLHVGDVIRIPLPGS